ncbi:MAG TPA: Ig-like domain-containing protein [Bacteroidales bacterium]|nr:Ig-like domain-containing protein [Bacteroidales bacterium]
MKLVKVFPIIAMLMIVFITGCNKKDEFSGVRPEVTSTNPISEAVSIAIGTNISAVFSSDMDPLTMTTVNFIVMQGTSIVPGTVSYEDSTAMFIPSAVLSANTLCNVKISIGAKNNSGMGLLNDYTWSFTTGALPDVTKPTVTLTDPLNNATGVVISKLIVVSFSEAMDPSTIASLTYTLKQGSTSVAGIVSYTGMNATFTPSANLAYSKVYTGVVTTGAKDVEGNSLAVDYAFSFTTADAPDTALPMVNSTDPLNNATEIAADKTVAFTFSEAMNASTINASTLTLTQGTTPVAGTVGYSDMTATFTPSANLAAGTTYTATVTTGVKDLAGNALAANLVWTFTTAGAPTVNSTDPLDLAADVSLYKVVKATFSVPMDQSTITANTFTVKQGINPVTGVVTYTGSTASFDPTYNFLPGTVYTATVTTGAKNVAGFPLASDYEWSFTTEATILAIGAVDLGAAANYLILAKTGISNISTSAITGNLGLSPAATSYITGLSLTNATGYATSAQVTGKIYAADMADPTPINLTTAVENMITAYNDAAGRPTPDFLELGTGNIGGKTITPGLYKWTSTVTAPSDVTISGGANDVWIFQISGDLLVSSAVNFTLIGGAQAKNIFWQVAGQATFGTTSHFEGIILSMTGINFQTGASFKGRALAQTAVVLDGNAVILP